MSKNLSIVRLKAKRICPVVAVTALVDQSVLVKAKFVGMKAVLNKPVKLS